LLAEALVYNHEYARSLPRIDEVLALAPPGSRFWSSALTWKLIVAHDLGARGPMMEVFDAIVGVEPEPEGTATFVGALALISFGLLMVGQCELSDACFARMERLGGPLMGQDAWVRGWMEYARGNKSRFQGDAWAALDQYRRSKASFAEAGYGGIRSRLRLSEAISLSVLGMPAESQQIFED